MKNIYVIILLAAISLFAVNKFQYAEVKVNSHDDIKFLQENKIDIDRTSLGKHGKPIDGKVTIYVTEDQYKMIESRGYSMKWTPLEIRDKASYRNNTSIADSMLIWQNRWPNICKRIQIGSSAGGLPIWVLKISDNVNVEEAEPEVKFVSTMHGDEVTGMEMEMFMIENILRGYKANNDSMLFIVNNTELYVMPLFNPDGNALVQRGNANGVDLNRNFPEGTLYEPNTPTGEESEIAAMINWSNAHNFVLSTNYHGGALVANYEYDADFAVPNYTYATCPDDPHVTWLAYNYSQRNTPMFNSTEFNDGITNGNDWYQVLGGMQDWNYRYYNDLDITLEISSTKWPSYSEIPGFWADNRSSMFWLLFAAHKGIYGVVTDASTGLPLDAKIQITGINKDYYTDPDLGDYYRILKPGTYSMTVSKTGYYSQTINNIVVSDQAGSFRTAALIDVQLLPVGAQTGGTFAINQTSLSYGNVNTGSSSVKTFTITNSHSSQIIIGTISTPTGYSVTSSSKESGKDAKNLLNYAVASNSSMTFNLEFTPTGSGVFNGNTTITSSDTNHATNYLAVTGTGVITPLGTPTLVTPSNGGNSNGPLPTFDWNDVSGATSYTLLVDNNSDFGSPEINQSLTISTYTSASALALGTYYWKVKAVNAYTESSYCTVWTINIVPFTLPFSEGFENTAYAPVGWSITDVGGTAGEWTRVTSGTNPTCLPQNGTAMSKFNSYNANAGTSTRLSTPQISFAGQSGVSLKFRMYHDNGFTTNLDSVKVYASLNGTNWTLLSGYRRYSTATGWAEHTVNLSTYDGQSVYIGFLGYSAYGNNIFIDNITISGTTASIPNIGLSVASLNTTAAPGGSDTDSFGIINTGAADLTYTITKAFIGNAGVEPSPVTPHTNNFTTFPGTGYTNSNWASVSSGAQITGNDVTGILTSPQFTTTDATFLNLDFDQNFSFQTGSTTKVEYNNGAGWAQVYYEAAGSTSAHQHITLSVGSTGQLRFTGLTKKVSGNTASWLIDNIVVSGTVNTIIPYTWLTISSSLAGTVTPSGSNPIDITCNAIGLNVGTYNANISIASNDPDEPSKVLPVEFVVATPLSTPGNVAVVVATSSEIDLGWDEVIGATLYRIYRSAEPYAGFTQVATSATNSWQDTNILSGNKYFYYITADNAK